MFTPPPPARSLPAVPNLEQQKKQARELLLAARANDPAALLRFRTSHPRLSDFPDAEWPPPNLALSDAQLVLAREYGFPSWPRLKAHIDAVTAEHRTHPLERELQYYDDRAHGLLEVLGDGARQTIEQVRAWHPDYADASDDAVREAAVTGRFTIADARLVYAREHGWPDWDRFVQHVQALKKGKVNEPFLDVLESGKRRDWPRVQSLLAKHPELVRARGTNGNSLLNLAAGLVGCSDTGGRTSRAHEPGQGGRLDPVRFLLALGADPNQPNDRGWTALHQAAYSNDTAMVSLLLSAGADVRCEAHGSGGTPVTVALFWGYREAPELLATVEVVPANLRVAAGLGRTDLIQHCFTGDGRLTTEAGKSRGFYRPRSGFPRWKQAGTPEEILDEALVWAAKANQVEAMEALVARGARVEADPYRGTPLIWAAANGRLEAARWLLDHGAGVNQRATFGGPGHGDAVTALHLAAQNGWRVIVDFLLERGADPTIEDNLYHGMPWGWAGHEGHKELSGFLKGIAAKKKPIG